MRRGDKASVDRSYTHVWSKMQPDYFLTLMAAEGLAADVPVFVATDEVERGWFAPIAARFNLSFAEDLDQPALLTALTAFPQPLWPDVLAILEQIVCVNAGRFVGTLPSTISGHITNARLLRRGARGDGEGAAPLFHKLHESCCDDATARDLLRLPGVASLDDVPCVPHAGNPWC